MSNETIPGHGEQGTNTSILNQVDISNMTDFELAQIVCKRWGIRKINGELHSFNQKCYIPIADRKQLNQTVLSAFWNEQNKFDLHEGLKQLQMQLICLVLLTGQKTTNI